MALEGRFRSTLSQNDDGRTTTVETLKVSTDQAKYRPFTVANLISDNLQRQNL